MTLSYKQALQKGLAKAARSPAYLHYVGSLPCVVCGQEPAGDANHLMGGGFGGVGTKASDLFVFPLCRLHHDEFHRDVNAWEETYGSQHMWINMTLHQAVDEGVLQL